MTNSPGTLFPNTMISRWSGSATSGFMFMTRVRASSFFMASVSKVVLSPSVKTAAIASVRFLSADLRKEAAGLQCQTEGAQWSSSRIDQALIGRPDALLFEVVIKWFRVIKR